MGRAVGLQIVAPRTTVVLLETDKVLGGLVPYLPSRRCCQSLSLGSSLWCNYTLPSHCFKVGLLLQAFWSISPLMFFPERDFPVPHSRNRSSLQALSRIQSSSSDVRFPDSLSSKRKT